MVTYPATQQEKTIPRIKGLPLLGNLLEYNSDRLELFMRVMRECGDIGCFYFGPYPIIQINHPTLVHSLLVEHTYDFDKGVTMHKAFEPLIGNGIFISEGDFHRRQRKLMAPSFQPRHIMNYADTMVRYGEQIQATWPDGEVIDVAHEMIHVTMSIIGKVLFDADVMTETEGLGAAIATTFEQATYALSHLFPIPLSWPTPRNWRARHALALLNNRIQQMIDDRRANPEERDDFLSILLRSQEEDGSTMSNEQVRNEALTLFGAGHETTATALTWVWYLLATHPEVYRRVQEEVDSVLQGRVPTYDDLLHLPYCLQVFKEAQRLYPPAYGVGRTALHDVELGDYRIKQGVGVIAAIYAMHRCSTYYPDPEKFDPERFTLNNEKLLPRYAYVPFGAGPRICIGNHFAMMEGHLLLATLAQRVTFDLVPGQNVKSDLSKTLALRPVHGLKVIVRRRSLQA
jgi:cytochrome P450